MLMMFEKTIEYPPLTFKLAQTIYLSQLDFFKCFLTMERTKTSLASGCWTAMMLLIIVGHYSYAAIQDSIKYWYNRQTINNAKCHNFAK
eukprot:scaffold5698_cov73-Cylindrotheca_fusiformis.AAC.2